MATQDHRPFEESRELILEALAQHPNGLTRSQIAQVIERAKSPHLINLIESLVDEGLLERQVKLYANGVQGYLYRLKSEL